MSKLYIIITVMLSMFTGMVAIAALHALNANNFLLAVLLSGIALLLAMASAVKLHKLFLHLEANHLDA